MNITFDDPRLTAYALGELDEAGRHAIETELQNLRECRREVEEITHAAAIAGAALASEPMPGLTSLQQLAIEAKLTLSASKPRLSWMPSAQSLTHWRLKMALAVIAALLARVFLFPAFITGHMLDLLNRANTSAACRMIQMVGTPVIKNGLQLTLPHPPPGLTLEVTGSCEAVYLNLSLLVVSVLVGSLFLRSPWKRLLWTLFVIPLIILKDAFRIFTLAELCAHLDSRSVLDSPFRHDGGPIFFALAFIPFIFMLIWLRKLESKP